VSELVKDVAAFVADISLEDEEQIKAEKY